MVRELLCLGQVGVAAVRSLSVLWLLLCLGMHMLLWQSSAQEELCLGQAGRCCNVWCVACGRGAFSAACCCCIVLFCNRIITLYPTNTPCRPQHVIAAPDCAHSGHHPGLQRNSRLAVLLFQWVSRGAAASHAAQKRQKDCSTCLKKV
jgi:hypothetical protein